MEEASAKFTAVKERQVVAKITFFEHPVYWRESHLVNNGWKRLVMDISVALAHGSDSAGLHLVVCPDGKPHTMLDTITDVLKLLQRNNQDVRAERV